MNTARGDDRMENWFCPLCGGNLLKNGENRSGDRLYTDLGYGKTRTTGLICENETCDYRVMHTPEREVLFGVALSHIRKTISVLNVADRAEKILAYRAIAKKYTDRDGAAYAEALEVLFHRVLADTLSEGKRILEEISHREPKREVRRATRRSLYFFMQFLSLMEGKYPSAEEEQQFERVHRALVNADCYYEVGQYFLETEPERAEAYLKEGAELGGVRSKVAYARHVLALREDERTMFEVYRSLAAISQEACYEYVRYAVVGQDNLAEALRTYAETSYPKRSLAGKLSFIRLQLTVFFRRYLAAMEEMVDAAKGGIDLAWEQRYRRVLSEMFSLIGQVADEVDGFEHLLEEYRRNPIAERMMLEEENLVLECAIGCAMYYQIRFDPRLRFDVGYLRECIGHLRCFLSSDMREDWAYDGENREESADDARNLQEMREYAEKYARILQAWCGMEGDAE